MPERNLRTLVVSPYIPERLAALQKIAYNLWWCWHHEAITLFRRIDAELFEAVDHSPVKLLGSLPQQRVEQLLEDEGFLAHLDRVANALDSYLKAPTWFHNTFKDPTFRAAYFSAEFGNHESVPIYSGGLGVLAGDHLKSASDLGVPLSGVSLLYRQGYFRQYLNIDGWQQETYPENDFYNLPLIAETDAEGQPLMVQVPFPGRTVHCRVWRIQVGRVPLYLLDTNLARNRADDREITAQLYGGDQENRIKQELILGVGGYRALCALGKKPTLCHMNEGHSAFLALERIRCLIEENGLSFKEAKELVTAGNVFTTHTPVPAGNDMFPPQLLEPYLEFFLPTFRIDKQELMGLGRQNVNDQQEAFCMTVLALKLANYANGVSRLHGRVSRKMWRGLWPDLPEAEVPIHAIVNGVHTGFWLSAEMSQLLERYIGASFWEKPSDPRQWKRVENIPDAELWRTHERGREQLVGFARKRLRRQLERRGAAHGEIQRSEEVLDPETLTIGFARRSATYKRSTLILRDLDRLNRIVNNKERPVQLIFAGKAHPHDKGGKELIQRIAQVARMPEFRRRIVFIDDYDMNVGRFLVHGVDVWLNNPRRPLEASGTSGMKVVFNGGLNFSVLDGWWDEGYSQHNGFPIGNGEEYTDTAYHDEIESRALYEMLEREIIPLFYHRAEDGVPRRWMRMVKESLKTLSPVFNTNRMVEDYVRQGYWPSHLRYMGLQGEGMQTVRDYAAWLERVRRNWSQIRIEQVEGPKLDHVTVRHHCTIKARVRLGTLTPDDVSVQIYHGLMDSLGTIPEPHTTQMAPHGQDDGAYLYQGEFSCHQTGKLGYMVRILPQHPLLFSPFHPGLVTWG